VTILLAARAIDHVHEPVFLEHGTQEREVEHNLVIGSIARRIELAVVGHLRGCEHPEKPRHRTPLLARICARERGEEALRIRHVHSQRSLRNQYTTPLMERRAELARMYVLENVDCEELADGVICKWQVPRRRDVLEVTRRGITVDMYVTGCWELTAPDLDSKR